MSFLLLETGGLIEQERDAVYILLEESNRLADQVEIQIPKTKVVEETSFPATAYFRTRTTKSASTPTTVHYRVDCLTTGKELQAWATVVAAANVSITMTTVFNEIQDDASRLERKRLTVQADQGLSTQINGSVTWEVRNIQGIT